MRFLFFLLCLLVTPHMACAGEITDIRMGHHPDKIRLVIEMTGDANFHTRVHDNPKRLVIHVPKKKWRATPHTADLIAPFTSATHKDTDHDLSHLSFSIDSPHMIRNAYMLPTDNQPNAYRLVIDMAPTDPIGFQREIEKSYGSLNLPNTSEHSSKTLTTLLKSLEHKNALPVPKEKPIEHHKPIIVIDPGHGGPDPGAISPGGIQEKEITLPMAKRIASILNQTGRYDARLTRTTDKYIKLHNRVKIARKANADLFISIHADSVDRKTVRGASIYTLSDKASDKQTAKLAARENQSDLIAGVDLGIEDPDVSVILLDLSMRETMNQSKSLANTVVGTFTKSGVKTLQRPHRHAGFAVLKAPDVPSVLIETGFVSNEQEARKLLSKSYQIKLAKALLKSLDAHFYK